MAHSSDYIDGLDNKIRAYLECVDAPEYVISCLDKLVKYAKAADEEVCEFRREIREGILR